MVGSSCGVTPNIAASIYAILFLSSWSPTSSGVAPPPPPLFETTSKSLLLEALWCNYYWLLPPLLPSLLLPVLLFFWRSVIILNELNSSSSFEPCWYSKFFIDNIKVFILVVCYAPCWSSPCCAWSLSLTSESMFTLF